MAVSTDNSDSKLQKLTIYAYDNPELSGDAIGSYETKINPEKYSLVNKSEYSVTNASGTSGGGPTFYRSLPDNLSLDFLFDRTGVFEHSPNQTNGIIDDLKEFKKIVYDYNGDQHRPNYLKVVWGDLIFPGVLTELNVEYKLFEPNGTPLRAVVKTTIKNHVEEKKRAARENKSSPDLTHYRVVVEGDNLPLMTHRIYGDSKYYLEIAKVNNLTNFRKLLPGQKLTFPPIEKLA